jgi:hypothetical protein
MCVYVDLRVFEHMFLEQLYFDWMAFDQVFLEQMLLHHSKA